MDNIFNNYEITEKKNNFSIVINIVTCFVCCSLGLLVFFKLLRMFNYDELYKRGFLQLSVLIFVVAMVAVFFVVRKFDIDFEKPTATILIVMSLAVIIFSVILFFNASEILFYILAVILLTGDLLLCILTKLTAKTKIIAIIISVLSLITINSVACKNLEYQAENYYFSLNNVYVTDDFSDRNCYKGNIDEGDYNNIQQIVNDVYTHQMMPIKSVNEWEEMFNQLSVKESTENNITGLMCSDNEYNSSFFKDNSLFLCLLPLENANDYVSIDDIVVADGMTSLRYTYYKDSSAQNMGEGFILTVIAVDKENEELLRNASYITDLDGETVCSKKTVVEV
ncbi:MAG: hypothetical protein UIM53_04550 [Acutalibacteraceae bacterium]|nr:hypothetical protein [Acutalibacteraceae bacterium]